MPRASAADAARTAHRIIDSAAQLFALRGLSEVRVDDIAERAGVTRGAVNHHFGDKCGLFRAVVSRLQEQVAEDVAVASRAAGPEPAARLRAGSHALLDSLIADSVVRVLLIDAPAAMGWSSWRECGAEDPAAPLHQALRGLGKSEESAALVLAQLSGAIREAGLWVAQHPDPASVRAEAHEVLDGIVRHMSGTARRTPAELRV